MRTRSKASIDGGTSEIVEWTSTDGETLQGVLCKPEGFEPNRKYPMIAYFYERLTDNLHQYTSPAGSRSAINPSFYVSRDYLVFMPDIPYIVTRPGQSAMNAVVPGVLNLINRGFVDREHIGVQGHSWGGYQIAYKGPGYQQQFSTQERIGGLPHEKREIYIERSPVYHVDKLQTPLLVHLADNDDVDFLEAEQLINALLVKKPDLVETKVYNKPPGGHTFNRRVNHKTAEYTRDDTPDQIDSWQRIFAFLDKHLK